MKDNFIVVLFKDKVKRKIINKFITRKRAENFYNKLIKESDDVIFEKEYENGISSIYEIGLLEKNKNLDVRYIKDELGRQIKVELEDDDYSISKIQKYRIEELIMDFKTKDKITTKELIKRYLSGSGVKMISKLNNKIIIQNEDKYDLFTLKNVYDSSRFIDRISEHFLNIGKTDCIIVKDVSTIQRKYLYEIMVEKGFPKRYLTRLSTTHLK